MNIFSKTIKKRYIGLAWTDKILDSIQMEFDGRARLAIEKLKLNENKNLSHEKSKDWYSIQNCEETLEIFEFS